MLVVVIIFTVVKVLVIEKNVPVHTVISLQNASGVLSQSKKIK
ncbi:10336_t:CDS:2 [Dentiscutata heterogama]|uniref:10336_t:CDS:1 n=1 Tax=Dentiscutata heterogama TaxID=1316150 RepID=A0ACA9KDX6_9GLOM|nr:10336_t:CDS:2 [Dentiscutata heterogama]